MFQYIFFEQLILESYQLLLKKLHYCCINPYVFNFLAAVNLVMYYPCGFVFMCNNIPTHLYIRRVDFVDIIEYNTLTFLSNSSVSTGYVIVTLVVRSFLLSSWLPILHTAVLYKFLYFFLKISTLSVQFFM